MKRLYVFDMDGTLLPKTTAMLEIAKITGHLEQLEALEKEYREEKIESATFTKTLFELWKTLSPKIVEEAFIRAPKLDNIKTVLETISDDGNISCLITSSQEFFARHFYDYGFDFIFASKDVPLQMEFCAPEKALQAIDKLLLSQELCQKLNISFMNTVAFGDSLSDIPLFQNLVHTISVNGDHHIHSLAAHHYQGMDLLEAFTLHSEAENSSFFR